MNTPYIVDAKGMIFNGTKFYKGAVIIRCLSDENGETLSLSDDKKIMLVVKVADIEKAIKGARNEL